MSRARSVSIGVSQTKDNTVTANNTNMSAEQILEEILKAKFNKEHPTRIQKLQQALDAKRRENGE